MELKSNIHLPTSDVFRELEKLKSINDAKRRSILNLQQQICNTVQEKNDVTSQFDEYRSEAHEIIRGAKTSVSEKTTILKEYQEKAEQLSHEVSIIRGELLLSENFEKRLAKKKNKSETKINDFSGQTEMELLQKSKYDELEKKYDLNIQKKEQLKTALEALKSKRSDLEEVLRNTFQKVDQLNAEVSSLHIENQQRQTAVVKVFTELDDFVCQKKKELQIITKKLSTEKDDTSAVNSSLPVIREEDFQKLPKLTCDLCGQQYQTKREMIFHMKSFHTRRRFKCNICFETFAFQQNCYAHIKNKHARLRDFKRFVRRISRKKKKGNRKNSGKLTCYLCGKQYKTKQGLSYHVESAHVRIKYKCQICSSTFVNQVYCFAHVKKIHWKWKDFRSFVKVVSQKNEVLETISKVENRMRTPIKPIAKVNNGYDQEHLLDFSDHPCNLCRKKYKSKQGLTIHKENFHAKIKFKCKICFKMFGYKQTCTSHIKIGHSKFTDYKRFIQAVSQEKKKFGIIETISENEEKETITTKPIHEVNPEGNLQDSGMPTCDLCGKQYLSKQGLAFHVENLHERRKFKCGICSKIFSYQQCCITHVKNEHSKSGDYRLFVNAFTDTEQKKQILSTALFK